MSTSWKCIIVDDEPLAIKVIKRHLEQIPQLTLVASCSSAIEAFELLKSETVDLIFLDIHMPMLSGIDFLKSLAQPPGIIFTTAYRNYAVESYELNVIDYLVKPISFPRFFQAVSKFTQQTPGSNKLKQPAAEATSTSDHIYVNTNKKYTKIAFREILYVESIKDYIRIQTEENRIITKDKISEFHTKLPNGFLRVHRSFIVNSGKITAFTATQVELGKHEIPIGNSYKQEVLNHLRTT